MPVKNYRGSRTDESAFKKFAKDGFALFPACYVAAELDALTTSIMKFEHDRTMRGDRTRTHVNMTFWPASVDRDLDRQRTDSRLYRIVSRILGTSDIRQHVNHIYFRAPGNPDSFRWH